MGLAKTRAWTLGTRLTIFTVLLVFSTVGSVSAFFIYQARAKLREAAASKTALMRDELRLRGMALANNVALASERALVTMDYSFLADVVDRTVKRDSEIIYGIIMDKEGMALVHSDPSKAHSMLEDDAAKSAMSVSQPTARESSYGGQTVLEAVAPINVGDGRWGTIRFGLSLARFNAEVARGQEELSAEMVTGMVTVGVAALLLSIGGVLAGAWSTRRMTEPLSYLMQGVHQIRDGAFDGRVVAAGSLEFVELAAAFNEMTEAVRERDSAIRHSMNELEVALEEAETAVRLKSEFLANISHELRTPLNAIVNVPESLLEEYELGEVLHCAHCGAEFEIVARDANAPEDVPACPDCRHSLAVQKQVKFLGDPAEHHDFLKRLLQSGKYLLTIVNDLLDISKLQAGKLQLYQESVGINAILRDGLEPIRVLTQHKHIEFKVTIPEDAGMVHADPVKLAQILTNIIGNAIKFTPASGRIEVTMTDRIIADVPFVEFAVSDTGVGIPQKYQEAIFESFRQVDGSHTRAHGGTGLGLSITKQLVELHGGTIWVKSVETVGSTFYFTIPRLPIATLQEPAQRTLARVMGKNLVHRVLVIDDNVVHLEVARRTLTRAGFETELVGNPAEAVERACQMKPDCIVLDVMMPGTNGVDVLRQLRALEATKHIPVIVSSAYHANRKELEALGATWMPKPWSGHQLLGILGKSQSAADTSGNEEKHGA